MTVINTVGCGIDTTSGGNFEHTVKVETCKKGHLDESTVEVIGHVEILDEETSEVRKIPCESENKYKEESKDEVVKARNVGGSHTTGMECYELR